MNKLHNLAFEAAAEVDANCTGWCLFPWLRGTRIHNVFAQKDRALGTDFSAEISYKDRLVQPYGLAGSVRADAVYGDIANPKFVVELKTGFFSWVSRGQSVFKALA
ncbi:hypothetical protein [Catenovulum sediminis]|uniref:Uncharacterized protein n=1 Tax=Catenovulum sediminis TaxID=1740262 RepID=A0ABV1RHK9_9ALTE